MGKTKEWHLNKSETEITKWINSRGKQISPLGRLILASENTTKLANALQTYADLEKNEIPLILYDDTMFGSGKDGFLITNKNVYTHKPFSEACKIAIDNIKVVCGNTDVYFFTISSGLSFIDFKKELIQFLNTILAKNTEQSDDEEDEDIDESEDIDDDDESDEEDVDSEFEKEYDDDEEYEEDEDDDESDEEDEEDDIEVSSKSLKARDTPRSKTFEGILYEKYGIGRGMNFDEAVEILEDDDWEIFNLQEDLYLARYRQENDEISEDSIKYVYSFPLMGIILAKYNDLLVGVGCMFSKELKDSIISFFNKQIFEKYNFSEKYLEFVGLDFYAPKNENNKSYQDYSRGIIFDDCASDFFVCYSFLHDSTFGPLWLSLENDWKKCLITDIDDDATLIFGERNQDYVKEDFFKLLKKWNDVLSREDEPIKITLPKDEQDYHGKRDQLKLVYKNSLNLYSYKTNGVLHEEFRLELSYKKDSREIQGFVTMHFGDSNESKFSKETKLCLQNLLLHLDEYDDEEEFSGEDMWDNLSEIINTELNRIKAKEENADKKRKQADKKFEDDFDNL